MSSTTSTKDDSTNEPILEVEDLSITYRMNGKSDIHAVQNVSFTVEAGTTFGLVGESGCGKTTAARALIGLLDDNGEITSGTVSKAGRDLTKMSEAELRATRWDEIATIPQNVMNALNPVETVGKQVLDVIQLHTDRDREAAQGHAEGLFEQVGLSADRLEDYPHEFSGGMLQRAVIAMAMSCDPDLIIADEPTTALDVVVQDEILSELEELQKELGVAVLVISHDIGVMAEICDDVGVMYAGELMEVGSAKDVFADPSNPYTLGLANSFPDITQPDRPLVDIPGTAPELTDEHVGCPFVERCPFSTEECETYRPELQKAPGSAAHHSRCHFVDDVERLREEAANPETWGGTPDIYDEVESSEEMVLDVDDVRKYYDTGTGLVDSLLGRESTPVKAVDGVSFDVREGEIFGIVGESGCGKSTLGRTLLNLDPATDGQISLNGEAITDIPNQEFRRRAQMIFQDPFESLNPRLTIQQTITEPLSLLSNLGYAERVDMATETLEAVGLSPATEYLTRFPEQLSGGERQRVSIARALVVDPSFLLADEPVSMLDVSIRASVLNILRRLRRDQGLTISIISHDLSLIRNISDRTAVMYLGKLVETGDTDRIVEDPKHPYTQALVNSVPVPDPTSERQPVDISGEPPSARNPPTGCRFHTRCPAVIPPESFEFETGRFRELMDLRADLDAGTVRVDRAREVAENPESTSSVVAAIKRRRFDGVFADDDAEAVVDGALAALVDGNEEASRERLAEAFTTPCELEEPELVEFEDGRRVACHLYD